MDTHATLGVSARLLVGLLVVTLLGLPSTADAAVGGADPEAVTTICSAGTLEATFQSPGEVKYVALDVPIGATVTYWASGRARATGHSGFLTYWGIRRADTLQNMKSTGKTFQEGSSSEPETWSWSKGPTDWTNWKDTTEFVGFASVSSHFKFDTQEERQSMTVRYLITVEGPTCSSLPDPDTIDGGLGENPTDGYSADPVNTGTGNFVHTAVDMDLEGPSGGLSFVRSYNSMDDLVYGDLVTDRTGVLGEGWTTTVDASLRPVLLDEAETDLEYRRSDGRRGAGGDPL